MRAERITARGFRNLAPLELPLPAAGAAILGPNGHGKTNLVELLGYPVLWRSVRGAPDLEVMAFGAEGFHLRLEFRENVQPREVDATVLRAGRRKRIAVDQVEEPRLGGAIGRWRAVTFLPADLALVQGAASERRRYLDQVLSLADPGYLGHLTRYRAALAQRNAALRQGRTAVGVAFDSALARHGAALMAARLAWTEAMAPRFGTECAALGEPEPAALTYQGNAALADPAAWPEALQRAAGRDQQLGATTVGPHRDDLRLTIAGRATREFGSTGQQRCAAIALRLCELVAVTAAGRAEPALLLDDVFAELDPERQARLAARLAADGAGPRQVFVTAPQAEDVPAALGLERFTVRDGRIHAGAADA